MDDGMIAFEERLCDRIAKHMTRGNPQREPSSRATVTFAAGILVGVALACVARRIPLFAEHKR